MPDSSSDRDTDRTPLFWQRRGRGEPLLLIQGMAGHHRMWGEPLLSGLEDGFEVIIFDHRGIGETTEPFPSGFTVADLAADAAGVLDAAGLDSAHVMGISMGGMVAQELALRHPERVRSLVLGCSYPGGPGSTLAAPGPLRMMQAMELATRTGDVDAAMRVAYEANLSPTFRDGDPSRYPAFRDAALAVPVPVPVVLQQARAAFAHDASGRLPTLDRPTLVIHGTADEMLDHRNGVLLAELVPAARLESVDGVGHLFWWERPDLTVQLLRQHCR